MAHGTRNWTNSHAAANTTRKRERLHLSPAATLSAESLAHIMRTALVVLLSGWYCCRAGAAVGLAMAVLVEWQCLPGPLRQRQRTAVRPMRQPAHP